ncbi:HAD-IIIA family hydrolase [Halobacillus naozhouensis]|uniref:D,D-heptose 1,7-bisphosphate phosphatase n=1 Tax=Halobacillus naozhouensis TaxID=554880 RepID=A0ABY8IXS3_9BACI|nr:HAD-IIIA family hydrolase [Halobacillus naozhouensis]WFT75047.1 HAD-IIIA family hydrolase [Halobacillus naozhouensis]
MKAIFVDRDGTMGGSDRIEYPGEFQLYPGVQAKFREVQENGTKLFSFTNQPGIAEGEATMENFRNELNSFGFDGVYVCPHTPAAKCKCRKPGTRMIERACKEHGLRAEDCFVIGDRLTDMLAATRAGCEGILVTTGAGEESLRHWQQSDDQLDIKWIAEDIIHALDRLMAGK